MPAAPDPQDASAAAAAPQRTGWAASLGPGSGVVFVACVTGLLYFRGQAVELYGPFALLWLVVPVPAIAFWGLVSSWLAFHLSGRKQPVSAAVFVVACAMFTLASVAQAVQHARAASIVTEVATAHADHIEAFEYDVAETDRVLAELERQHTPSRSATPAAAGPSQALQQAFGPGPEADGPTVEGADGADHLARFRRGVQSLKRVGNLTTGRESRSIKAMIQVIETMDPLVADYTHALDRFTDAGGVDPHTLPNARTIDERLAKLAAIEAATVRQRRAYEGLEGRLQDRLEALGESPAFIAEFLRGWRIGMNMDLVLAVQETDQRLFEAMRGMLETLRSGMASWRINPARGLEFDTDALLNQYTRHQQTMLQAAREQVDLQRQLLQKQKALW